MQRFVLIVLTSLALAGCGFAQQANSGSVPGATVKNGGIAPQHLGLETVVGCLSKGPDGTYALTGGAPGPKQFRIISGDLAPLKHAEEKDVEVLGIVGQNNPVANQDQPYNSGTTTGVGYLTIKAEQVKVLGHDCSMPGQEWVGDHMNKK
jgi:hypothetical protein